LPEVVSDIDANPMFFMGGEEGVSQVWTLTRSVASVR